MKLRYSAKLESRNNTFYVTGESGGEYTVHHRRSPRAHRRVWTCNCRDFTERRILTGEPCKHIVYVQVRRFLEAYPAVSKFFTETKKVLDNRARI